MSSKSMLTIARFQPSVGRGLELLELLELEETEDELELLEEGFEDDLELEELVLELLDELTEELTLLDEDVPTSLSDASSTSSQPLLDIESAGPMERVLAGKGNVTVYCFHTELATTVPKFNISVTPRGLRIWTRRLLLVEDLYQTE